MIFDFNVPYSADPNNEERPVGFMERAERAGSHVLNIPIQILTAIVQIAKLALFAVACAFTFGQSRLYNNEFMDTGKSLLLQPLHIAIAILGVFAPIKADNLEGKLNLARMFW